MLPYVFPIIYNDPKRIYNNLQFQSNIFTTINKASKSIHYYLQPIYNHLQVSQNHLQLINNIVNQPVANI